MDLPTIMTQDTPEFWFEILPENKILLKSPKAEMGQGIFTGFRLIAAEELDVKPEQIVVVPGSTASAGVDLTGTGGSNTTYSLFEPLLQVSAIMRETLKMAAAEKWGVNPSDVKTKEGVLSNGSNKITYAELTSSIEEWEFADAPELRPSSSYRYVGSEVPRADLEEKVLGTPIFGLDQEMDGMLRAMVLYSPYIGGKLKSVDTSAAEKVPGVMKVVNENGLVAVVAESRYAAEAGRNALKPEWDVPKAWQQNDLDDLVSVNGDFVNVQKQGSVNRAFKNAPEVIESEYRTPLGVHAHMEPNGTIAEYRSDGITLKIGTQVAANLRMELSQEFDVDQDKIDVQVQYLGGGFGRRYFNHNAFEADGKLDALEHKLATGDMFLTNLPVPGLPAILAADLVSAGHGTSYHYNVKNRNAEIYQKYLPFQTGIWRAVGMFANTFAKEAFVDELAVKAGKDPIDFRMEYLTDGKEMTVRFRKALESVRDRSGWDSGKEDGVGRGVAIAEDRGTVAAAVIEVREIDGRIRATKVTHATDPGIAVNPEGIRQQVEGSIMMGISATLYEGTYVKDGKFVATNYHQYPMATLMDVPEIEVIILENSDHMTGIGEPPLAPIAPALAAAYYDLTGERKRSLPLLS
ncbi:iorB [Symbiodinium microadriaticum]|nr:iorB [Symbiodinium microadriaticum]